MSISMMSPSRIRPIGPPTAASGLTWPIERPGRAARESAVGDQAHVVAQADPLDGRRGGEHLLHARAPLGAFVADDHHVARLDLAEDDAVVGVLLALEDHGRAGVPEHLRADAGRLDHRPLRGEVAGEHRQAAGPGIGLARPAG